MRLALSIDTTAGRRRIELLVRAVTDVQPALKAFGGYLRGKFKERFSAEGPGWPPLAQSTGHRLIHTYSGPVTKSGRLRKTEALRRMKRALARDVEKGRLDAGVFFAVKAAMSSSGGGSLGERIRFQITGRKDERQLLRLARQFDRAQSGRRRSLKRAITKHRRLLGRLGSTIRAQLQGASIVVGSFVPWAGVHNEGGPAGHGAIEPKRTFAELEEDDVDVLAEVMLDRGIEVSKRGL